MSDLISRQAVIEKMRNHRRLFCKNNIEYSILSKDEKARVDEIDNCIACLLNEPKTESELKWISVSERLPEDGERVLITHKGGVSLGWYNGIYWERGASTKHRPLQTVIAWMPLPESYKGD